jgi:hypothetical protein
MRTCPPPQVVHSHRRNGRQSGRSAVRQLAVGGFDARRRGEASQGRCAIEITGQVNKAETAGFRDAAVTSDAE